MKKRAVLFSLFLAGSILMVGCTSKPKAESNTSSNMPSNEQGQFEKNDDVDFGAITEDDVESKTKENIKGEEVIKYQLKDGSAIIAREGDDDLDKINEALQKDSGETKKID